MPNTFWPTDTDERIYTTEHSLKTLIELVQNKWPGVDFGSINISASHIQTNCIGYDLYDSSDYTDFIVIECIKDKS